MPKPTLRVFVSSPGDVAEERVITGRVLKRVADRFASVVALEPIFWEHEPLLATGTFQDQIERPSKADIFICILWSRLGTRLPPSIHRDDGSTYQSGTEFEFEDAFDSYRRHKAPDLIVYRKTAEPFVSLKDRDVARQALAQSELLDEFIAHWFHGKDGTLIAAFHPFRDASEFEEHLEMHLIKLVGAKVKRSGVSAKAPPVTWTAGSPYRGLEAFEFEHEPIFFGRTRAVSGVLRALREQAEAGRPFVLVLGASGSGKSSLVKAGVLPMLTRLGVVPGVAAWRRAVLRPGDARGDLWLALATALLRPEAVPQIVPAGLDPAKVAALLRDNPQRVLDRIKQVLGDLGRAAAGGAAKDPGAARLALVLDQLEEVFTLENVTAENRTAFFRLVEEMTRSGVWVLATLRSDFYHRCAEAPELARLKAGKGQFDLQPPTPSEVASIIRQPAIAAGLRFGHNPQTGERLEELLCDAAVGHSGSLPLLEFALDELYKRRSDKNALTLKAYADLGGLEGALAKRAAEVFGALPPPVQARLPRVFRQLATISADEHAAPARKPAALGSLKGDPLSAAFVDAFVSARLLSTRQGADGAPQAEITHEALLTRWPPLRKWLAADRELLRVHSRVAAAAELWAQQRRSAERLLQAGQPLDEARRLLKAGFSLSSREKALVAASYRRARRGRWARRAAVAGLAALAFVALVFGIFAERNRREAEGNFTDARQTVDDFVTEISRDDLAVIPGLQDMRQEFANRAVKRYELFAARRPGDLDVRLGLAKAARGVIVGGIGSLDAAQKELEEAITLHEKNVREDPKKLEYRLALATARNELGNLFWQSGQDEDARQNADSAIKDLELLAGQRPDNAEVKFQLADAYNLRGNVGRESGIDVAQAKADYERSRDLYQEILPVYPRRADCLTGVSAPLHNLALIHKGEKEYNRALELFDQSQEYDRQAAALAPLSPGLLSNQSIGLENRGDLLQLMKRPDDARQAYGESVRLSREVVQANPKVTRYRWLLADSLRTYAAFLSSRKEHDASRKNYEESCQILEDLTQQVDDRPQYAAALIESRLSLATFHQGAIGEGAGVRDEQAYERTVNEALETARRLAAKYPKAPSVNFQLAAALSQCAELEVEAKRDEKALPLWRECLRVYDRRVWVEGARKDPDQTRSFLQFASLAVDCAKRLDRPTDVFAIKDVACKIGKGCLDSDGIQNLAAMLNIAASLQQKDGRNQEAIETYLQSLQVCRSAFEKATWNWWLRQSVGGAYRQLAELYELVGDIPSEVHAREEFLRIWGGPVLGMKTADYIDPETPPSEAEAHRLRNFMAELPAMMRFTVQADFNGLKYPFQIYITDVPWPKDALEDQAKWLEDVRGGTIPEEVRTEYRDLQKLAHEKDMPLPEVVRIREIAKENNASFKDLLEYVNKKK